jgi:hypothetical protein
MGAELPAPVSVTDEYLRAIHDELVGLRADLAAADRGGEPAALPAGQAELTEPSPAKSTARRAPTKNR